MNTDEGDPWRRRGHARTGQTLRQGWRLDQLLSVDPTVAVYAATHRTGARATVKILHLDRRTDARARERFVRDGYLANAVNWPGALRVLDDGTTEDGAEFLVLESLDGESLEERRLRRGGWLPVEEVMAVADQLLALLVAAHGRGLTGADLEPDRLFLARDGSLRLLDFGVCRGGDRSHHAGAPAQATATPSSGQGESAAEVDDLRSLGALLRRLATGRLEPESLVPAPLELLIAHAQSADPGARWASARAMQNAVTQVRARLGPGVAPLLPPPSATGTSSLESVLASDVSLMAGREDARIARAQPGASSWSLLVVVVFVVSRRPQDTPVTETSVSLALVPRPVCSSAGRQSAADRGLVPGREESEEPTR